MANRAFRKLRASRLQEPRPLLERPCSCGASLSSVHVLQISLRQELLLRRSGRCDCVLNRELHPGHELETCNMRSEGARALELLTRRINQAWGVGTPSNTPSENGLLVHVLDGNGITLNGFQGMYGLCTACGQHHKHRP